MTLADRQQVVARVARRFMPRLKTESEVATMQYLREHTAIPVPIVYHYDSNPYNRLGGEFIIMSKVRTIGSDSIKLMLTSSIGSRNPFSQGLSFFVLQRPGQTLDESCGIGHSFICSSLSRARLFVLRSQSSRQY